MKNKITALILILLISTLLVTGCTRRSNPEPSPASTNLKYFGVGQLRLVVDQMDYLSYIEEQKSYSNIIGLSFEFDGNQNIIAPKESYLAAVESYEKTALMLGRTPWELNRNDRQALFDSLKNMDGYENIDIIVIIDEPYLWDLTPAELKEIILEGRETFPDKELTVNYNPKEFFAQNQGPNAPLYDEYLDHISFDMYPSNNEVACDDEANWKQKTGDAIGFYKSKTDKPILYVGQGFSKKGCVLTPEMIQWSYDVANAENIQGIMFWFSEDIVEDMDDSGLFTGFTNPKTAAAERKVIELGKRVIKSP